MSNYTEWKTAVSTDATDLETLRHYKECSIDAIELCESYSRCENINWQALKKNAAEAGIELWSYHLPFGEEVEIASPDEERRLKAVSYNCALIDRALETGISRFIIHPSFEPIPHEKRSAYLHASCRSLAELAQYADERNAVICVEDLPRSCIGHTVEEMLTLLNADSRLKVCFDVNHLLSEFGDTHHDFVEKLGSKIITTHMSDYDYVDEKHFFPGIGMIDWKSLVEDLEAVGYTGPFLFEGGFSPSHRAPEVPFGKIEDAHDRHMHIKEFRGKIHNQFFQKN